MKLVRTDRFKSELAEILIHVAKDSPNSARNFKNALRKSLENIPNMPYKCRQSLKSNDENIRDLIYQGYVVPYRITDNTIEVIGIFSQNNWEIS
ncbi:MAG: type II toxin-antitoxin system RelE/ParE family toxin [Campylobacterales bacterium]